MTEAREVMDLTALAASMDSDAPGLRASLEGTWRDPEAYEDALFAHLTHLGRPPQSLRGRHYNLYAELVARHRGSGDPAVLHPERRPGAWLQLSYAELHEMSGRLATQWLAEGVAPGARVFIVLPPGPAALLCLLTIFRLGAVGSLLPPDGRGFVLRRLRSSAPHFVVRRVEDANWVDEADRPTLPLTPSPGVISQAASRSHGYLPDAAALEVWSPYAFEAPVEVSAAHLFRRLASDAVLTLGIGPGTRVGAPDGVRNLVAPALPLAVLFAGATWVETDVDRLLGSDLVVHRILVGTSLRDRLLEGSTRLRGCQRWWVSPSDPHEWKSWRAFGEAMAAQGARGQNLLISSGFGGALLFSQPAVHPGFEVFPSPGWDWVLEEPGAPGQPTASPSGRLAGREETFSVGACGQILLSDDGRGFALGSAGLIGPRGTRLPTREIARVAEGHPAIDAASLVVMPDARVPNAVSSTLVAFVDPSRDPRPVHRALEAELRARLATDLGRSLVPDHFRIYPLTPRRDASGDVDPAWCQFQLRTGALDARARDDVFRISSTLRRWAETRAEEVEAWPSP